MDIWKSIENNYNCSMCTVHKIPAHPSSIATSQTTLFSYFFFLCECAGMIWTDFPWPLSKRKTLRKTSSAWNIRIFFSTFDKTEKKNNFVVLIKPQTECYDKQNENYLVFVNSVLSPIFIFQNISFNFILFIYLF